MIRMIGYWIESFEDSDFLAPQELVAEYPAGTKQIVASYLEGGRVSQSYLGRSWCRFPGCTRIKSTNGMGSDERTDGVWAWPEGLVHYVVEHNVMLPEEFISHVVTNSIIPRSFEYDSRPSGGDADFSFWIGWCRRHGTGVVRQRIDGFRDEANQAVEATFKAKCQNLEQKMGLALECCQWKNCEQRALQGKAFCLVHGEGSGFLRDAQQSVLNTFFTRCLKEA